MSDFKSILSTLTLGLHSRIGHDSPIQMIDKYVLLQIAESICPLSLLQEMLDDTKHMELYEDDVNPLSAIIHTYWCSNDNQLFNERMDAYASGQKHIFLNRDVAMYHCYQCDTRWYGSSYPGDNRTCPQCGQQRRIFIRKEKMSNIPPWINIATYHVYTQGIPQVLKSPRHHSIYDDDDYYSDDN